MDGEILRQVLLVSVAAGGTLWLLSALIFRVGGTWERVVTDEERAQGARAERVTFVQLGPLVKGRRDVVGGHQEFSGWVVGRTIRLTRRDHGPESLVAQGFPEAIATLLDGEVMARLRLRLTDGGTRLSGDFLPQKVEFTHQPPKLTGSHFLAPQPRSYTRVVAVTEPAEAWREPTGEHAVG